jgi:hypothetical protein
MTEDLDMALFIACALLAIVCAAQHRLNVIDEVRNQALIEKRGLAGTNYRDMLLDLRKWTFKQFYPETGSAE